MLFGKKEINVLEVKVAALATKVSDLTQKTNEQEKEIAFLKETVNMLATSCTVVQFGVDEEALAGLNQESAELLMKMEEAYNRKLTKVIRNVVNKKKPKDGKKTPAPTK